MTPTLRASSLLVSMVALSACRGAEPSRERQPELSAAPSARQAPELGPHRSPVTVSLVGPSQVAAGQDIEVVARIEQRTGTDAPVELELDLPEGARLVSGSASELLPAGNGVVERRFVVHLDRVPSADIQLVAKARTTSFGARAKSAYRFGRPEPRFAEPVRTETPLKVGGRSVGTPIRLEPAKP